MPEFPETIFALSSGRPPAAIAVIRISGPHAGNALHALIGRLPEPRRAALGRVHDPASGELIDEALALWFPRPNSETGEDTAELQLHGGRAVIAATLAALGRIDGLRPAEAGEFTRRAFANGRLDLTAVEGLADLIAAETEAQRRQAFGQLKGALGGKAEEWRQQLIEAAALVEAGIDFSDTDDVPENLLPEARRRIEVLGAEIEAALADTRGERLRDGMTVAIAGPPNAGKSTLLNRIAKREAAIVSPHPGTTRDVIEVHLDLGGYPVTVLDTAGIRDTADEVEMEGVNRARARAIEADLVLWVVDCSQAVGPDALPTGSLNRRFWLVANKADLLGTDEVYFPTKNESKRKNYLRRFLISAENGMGIDSLLSALEQEVSGFLGGATALVTRARHRHALEKVRHCLRRAGAVPADEIMAEELRLAARELGRLTGRIDVEDLLDVIFRDFCIGK